MRKKLRKTDDGIKTYVHDERDEEHDLSHEAYIYKDKRRLLAVNGA